MLRLARVLSVLLPAAVLQGCAGLHADEADPAVRRGPIRARSNGPFVQQFPTIRPRSAHTTPPGAVDLQVLSAYSSIFEVGSGPAGSVSFDGELWRTSAFVRTGLGERTDVEIEIPFLYASSGFLDVFIETWHGLLGLPDSGRETRPQFDYDMRLTAGGEDVFELTGNRFGLCDIPITLTQRVIDARGAAPSVYVSGLVELPTGSEDDGFGNGALEWGVGVGLESTVDDWSFGGGVGWNDRVRPTSFVAADLDVDDGIGVRADAEWRWTPESSLLIGLRFENAVSDDLGIEELSGDVLELDLGVAIDDRWDGRWIFGFAEDLLSKSGPDFTAMLGYQTRF